MTSINHKINKGDITLILSVTMPRAFKSCTWLAMRFIILAGMVAPFGMQIAIEGQSE